MAENWQVCSVPIQCHRATLFAALRYQPRAQSKGKAMKKMILAAATAASLAAAAIVAPAPAQARDGGAIAAGVIGGLAAGALIGSAAANAAPPAYYAPGPAYVAGPPCYWQRQRFWDGYGWRIRNVQVCQ
jgi:hypothetical protein